MMTGPNYLEASGDVNCILAVSNNHFLTLKHDRNMDILLPIVSKYFAKLLPYKTNLYCFVFLQTGD